MKNSDDRIRTAVVLQSLAVGGMETMVVDLCNQLPERYAVTVCCYDGLGPLQARLQPSIDIELIERKPGFDLGFVWRLRRLLRKKRIEVLHLHNHTALVYGTMAARLTRVAKIVYTEHGRTEELSTRALRLQRFLSRYVDTAVAVSEDLAELLRREGFRPASVRHIANGVADSYAGTQNHTVDEHLRDELGLGPSHRVIGIVARLDPIKNHSLLLRAMQTVVAAEPDARLLIVGDGSERARLEAEVRDLGLSDTVRFLGQWNDVPGLMALFDVYVLCSLSEGTSLTLLEAMAAGRPSVVTRVGGNESLITSEVHGLVVPSEDSDALATALLRVLGDSTLASKLAKNARARFATTFTLDRMVQRYREVFEAP